MVPGCKISRQHVGNSITFNAIDMKKLTFNPWRHFLLALALPAVAICAGLQSCSEDDGPGLPADKETDSAQSRRNPLMRSPEEAIDIAQRAWEDFYGDGEAPASRSSRGVIDYGRPVEVVRGAGSRGGSSDTLLYVVNFADDGGFAVIAAPRGADELLAVTSQGHYYPESQPDQEKVPGFELWMENAKAYSSIVFDSTKIVKPIDPGYPGLLQQREWEDTIRKVIVSPQIRNCWGQGNYNTVDLNSKNCEGYYYVNGLCGCGALSLAQVCCGFGYPQTLYKIRPGVGQIAHFDWEQMSHHKKWTQISGLNICDESGLDVTHEMIAMLCRIIGDYGEASYSSPTATSMSLSGIKKAAEYIFGSVNVSSEWGGLLPEYEFSHNEMLIVAGSSQFGNEAAHAWVCDGGKHIEYIHYYATRRNSDSSWDIQTAEKGRSDFHHYNWGWNGDYDGWYMSFYPVASHKKQLGYRDLKFIKISKPN